MTAEDAPKTDEFVGKVIVITGAASGIGRETALLFAGVGAKVLLADINASPLEQLAAQIGNSAMAVCTDVSHRDQLEQLADIARKEGPIEVWVNAAGIVAPPAMMVDVDEAMLDQLIAINLKGVYFGSVAAARRMVPENRGSIVNISSQGAEAPVPGISCYSLTKAAVNAMTRTLAAEVGPAGVRVNAVAPGFIDTPMVSYRFKNADGSLDQDAKRQIFESRASTSALHRVGQPIEIAKAIFFLASSASSFVTGETLRANGGGDMR